MLFENGIFHPEHVTDNRTEIVLNVAVNRTPDLVCTSDVLAAAIESHDAKIWATVTQACDPGCTPEDLLNVIEVYHPARSSASDFDGSKEYFSPEVLDALDLFVCEIEKYPSALPEATLELLLACILKHLDKRDSEYLSTLNREQGSTLFYQQVLSASEPLLPLFDSASGRLRSEEFSEDTWTILENAAIHASNLGYHRILPPHCFLAFLGETEGVAEYLVRLQAQPEIGPGKVAEIVSEAFRLTDNLLEPLALIRENIGESSSSMFKNAQKTSRLWGSDCIEAAQLFFALLDDLPPRLASVLTSPPLSLNIELMREHLEKYLRESRSRVKQETSFRMPPGLLPSEDLTYRARTSDIQKALHLETYCSAMSRALFRRSNNHVLVMGPRGVGKTSLVWELARQAARGDISFLKRKRFIWVDGSDVDPQNSREKLESLFSHCSERTDLILCLDGLGQMLRAESGGHNKLILRKALKKKSVHLIGVISKWDFEDLLSSDHDILEYFTQIILEEPSRDDATDIVKQACNDLETEYKVRIEDKAIERAVTLSLDYILNERLPTKAIKILRQVCEDLEYDRSQLGYDRTTVSVADITKVVSDISGVPEETLSGYSRKVDYEEDFGRIIIGQDEAIHAVATELQLIKAGLTDPGKPASVMLFAGLTGVGKTELAKTLARFYSSSKRLQTYTMGNFTEPHSVSGIIGVPPGYVGHEQGGRFINDLNADPYCVFLLDEAEKAHPEVWKPFLNLFDEGWIVDQRGVKAFADRAIIILTSNAGSEIISEMSKRGKSIDDIIEAVKKNLSEVRHERSHQPVFSPEFLARISRIIVFKPLDETAMIGICKLQIAQMQKTWNEKREKTVIVPENLIQYTGRQGHTINTQSGGQEGGRIIRKLLREWVETAIQQKAGNNEYEYKKCTTIKLVFIDPGPVLPRQVLMRPKIEVTFLSLQSSDRFKPALHDAEV